MNSSPQTRTYLYDTYENACAFGNRMIEAGFLGYHIDEYLGTVTLFS